MKVLLKHRRTGEYFKSPDQWTANVDEAFQFADREKAAEFYMRHYLPDVEVVVDGEAAEKRPNRGGRARFGASEESASGL